MGQAKAQRHTSLSGGLLFLLLLWPAEVLISACYILGTCGSNGGSYPTNPPLQHSALPAVCVREQPVSRHLTGRLLTGWWFPGIGSGSGHVKKCETWSERRRDARAALGLASRESGNDTLPNGHQSRLAAGRWRAT